MDVQPQVLPEDADVREWRCCKENVVRHSKGRGTVVDQPRSSEWALAKKIAKISRKRPASSSIGATSLATFWTRLKGHCERKR